MHPIVFFCIINKRKVWGNSNFKACYLHLDFMEMVSILDIKTIKGHWHSSSILKGINDISTAWEEVPVKCLKGVWGKLL